MKLYFRFKTIAAVVLIMFSCNYAIAQDTTLEKPAASKTIPTKTSDSVITFNLLSFTGYNSNGQNTFSWKTDSRSMFVHFALEVSTDKSHFTTIGDIKPSNTNGPNSFTYVESTPTIGRSYYRLKLIDSSGVVSYSTIIFINNIAVSNIQIQYEAGSGTIAISGTTKGTSYQLKLYNSGGQMLLQKTITTDQLTVSISHLVHGLYVVYVSDGATAPISRKVIW